MSDLLTATGSDDGPDRDRQIERIVNATIRAKMAAEITRLRERCEALEKAQTHETTPADYLRVTLSFNMRSAAAFEQMGGRDSLIRCLLHDRYDDDRRMQPNPFAEPLSVVEITKEPDHAD